MNFKLKGRELIGTTNILGVDLENKSEIINIVIEDSSLLEKWPYLEFDNGEKYVTPKLTISNNVISYTMTNSLMKKGSLKFQLVFKDANNFVFKSLVKEVTIKDAINASEAVEEENPDFIATAQEILDEAEEAAASIGEVESHEAARVLAEQTRASNETARVSAETTRGNQETTRQANEATRGQNETNRVNAETSRAAAEQTRATEFSGWVSSMVNIKTFDPRLINLEEAGKVTLFNNQEDTLTAYSKAVPTAALPYAKINKVGGKTYKVDNTLIDTPVTSIVSDSSININAAIRALDGYGKGINDELNNYIDFDRKKFVKTIGALILNGSNSESWDNGTIQQDNETIRFALALGQDLTIFKANSKYLCDKLQVLQPNSSSTIEGISTTSSVGLNRLWVFIKKTTIGGNTRDDFKNWLSNNPLTVLYEVATPVETDVSQYIDNNYIKVNGSVTFTNEHNQAAPNKITYSLNAKGYELLEDGTLNMIIKVIDE